VNHRGGRSTGRGRGALAVVAATLAIAVGAASQASGESSPAPIPPSFSLEASNGYRLNVLVLQAKDDVAVLLVAYGPGGAVTYIARAGVSPEGRLRADLGAVGGFDLAFRQDGEETVQGACGDAIRFQSGFYEGVFRFAGEEGFARASTSRVRANARLFLGLFCDGAEWGEVRPGPGAGLTARRGSTVTLKATTNGGRSPSRFFAGIRERREGLGIHRSVLATGPPGAFEFDEALESATVAPPGPFEGEGRFDRAAPAANRWVGGLTVDFPGRSDVKLVGRAFAARLFSGRFSGHPHG
jgi:hypothetical protein